MMTGAITARNEARDGLAIVGLAATDLQAMRPVRPYGGWSGDAPDRWLTRTAADMPAARRSEPLGLRVEAAVVAGLVLLQYAALATRLLG